MKAIRAEVSDRLLSKASRLFTGTLDGRINEILQNARRAGATRVEIGNSGGKVTVHDNGGGIEHFAKVLHLGASDWDRDMEDAEDPAGVGIFSLATRSVTFRSRGRMMTIEGRGWTGAPVVVRDDPDPVEGTILRFADKEWSHSVVVRHAVFCGMSVTVDGKVCAWDDFVSENAVSYSDLGCRIEAREKHELTPHHLMVGRGRWETNNVLVNFYGQVVTFAHHPAGNERMNFLVDLTGEPTALRLMLPARTCLVENEALGTLKHYLEREAYRYIKRRGRHRLTYKQYKRAAEFGFTLPEAEPTYSVGLAVDDLCPEPVRLEVPEEFPLEKCWRLKPDADESEEVNAHLLAALGNLDQPFVPVRIAQGYDGYGWAKLPFVERVEVAVGCEILRDYVWFGTITCVRELTIRAHTSDGRRITSPVCMALAQNEDETDLLVTPAAAERLAPEEIWYHLGGQDEEGDSYDTQRSQFEEALDRFWADVSGPDESLRRSIVNAVRYTLSGWRSVVVSPDGVVTIHGTEGPDRVLRPPGCESAPNAGASHVDDHK